MRVVVSRTSQATKADLPDGALLAEARSLNTRFASARLRPCSLVRMVEADSRAGARVWAALESLQVTGSFKIRGALLALSRLASLGEKRVVASSAGNHGAGVAYAANVLDVEATIVVPRGTPENKRERIVRYGAEIRVANEDGYDAAEREARSLAEKMSAPFVSPYDDVVIAAGNGASLAYEIESALDHAPDVILAPFGGGGLATGLACALPKTRVFGAQSEASPAFAMSIERGSAVETLDPKATLAEGLEGGISAAAFERARAVVAGVAVVSERAIGAAMAAAYRSLGVAIEGSAATGLAILLEQSLPRELAPASRDRDLVVVVTGRNVDRARLDAVLEENTEALW